MRKQLRTINAASRTGSSSYLLSMVLVLYAVTGAYGALTYALGDLLALLTIIIGFGLPILLWLAVEWVYVPLTCIFMGVIGREAPVLSVVFGIPLVLLCTFVSPVISTGSPDLPVPVPWLALYAKKHLIMKPILMDRGQIWLGLYLLTFIAAYLSRLIWPGKSESPTPKIDQRKTRR